MAGNIVLVIGLEKYGVSALVNLSKIDYYKFFVLLLVLESITNLCGLSISLKFRFDGFDCNKCYGQRDYNYNIITDIIFLEYQCFTLF